MSDKIDSSIELPDISPESKIQLLQNLLQTWHNTYYVATANAKIAKVLGDPKMLERATSDVSRAMQAINVVSEMIENLKSDD